jgi:hypothetical protein
VELTAEFAQLQLGFVDQTQWRYEVIRPLVLFADRTAQQRAQETHTHPDTVRTLRRRFRQQGMLGLSRPSMTASITGNWRGSCRVRSGRPSMTGWSRSSGSKAPSRARDT